MKNFTKTINYCGLQDLGFFGPKFTWLDQRAYGLHIREQLDRAMATLGWINIFPEAKLFHLTSPVSDHSPLALQMVQKLRKKKARKNFRFESMWLRDQRCEEVQKHGRKVSWQAQGVCYGAAWKCVKPDWKHGMKWNLGMWERR